jgi:dTMP kinase
MTPARSRPVFVVFEGLDGTGKSTCARHAAETLDARYLTTPSPALRAHRDEIIESFGGSQEACQLFYLSTVFAASQEVRALLAAGRSVVLDRYFLSTQAYAAFRGSRLDLDELATGLLAPDVTVLLHAPLAVRRTRVAKRGESHADRETLRPAADARLHEEHERRVGLAVIGRLLRIDASTASPDDIAARLLATLRG